MRGRSAVAVVAILAAGCQTAPRAAPPQEEHFRVVPGPSVPVPVPCVEDRSQRPSFVDTDAALAAIPDAEAGANLYRAAIIQYRFWVGVLEAQFAACGKKADG